ncbi:hypothetical protein DM02DRAFT_671164 [Periconia macrospinosa]|uniref:Rhodopsin domain-containing protein n=1 Tax=Periconia macrospinosa TaxID=97972 RepID=A0A2V1DWD1_9PLEO|nr:hypothetical protein DM02DRAFT_671164 [Periconia macrospinosa]
MDKLFHSLPPEKQRALLLGPAIPPPHGVVPNFENPPNSRHVGWIVTILGISLSTISVVLRLYSRAVYTKKLEIEDYITLVALGVFGVFDYYVMRIVVFPGYYVHTWDLQLQHLSGFLYNLFTGAAVHGIVVMLLKAAILLELIRIFSARGQRGLFFWTCHTLIWLNVAFYTTCTFVEIFACSPREKLWNKLIPGGRCIDSNILTLASSIINVPSDIIILILPQRMIWRLQVSSRKKLGISMIFAVAIFACVSAAIRLGYSVQMLHSRDVLYHAAPVGVWIQAEITAGFMILGISALPRLVREISWLRKWATIVKSWTNSSKEKKNSRGGLPSWYRPEPRKVPNENGWSVLELDDPQFLTTHNPEETTTAKSNDGTIRSIRHERVMSP